MNILIVGNGFDLSHYLPTKYDHFMVAMDAIEKWDESKGDMGFDDLFENDYWHKNELTGEEWQNSFFQYTKAIYKTDEIKISVDQIKDLKEQLKENVWYQYFSDHVREVKTWIDFETKIKKALEVVFDFFEQVESLQKKIDWLCLEIKHQESEHSINNIILRKNESYILSVLKILKGDFYYTRLKDDNRSWSSYEKCEAQRTDEWTECNYEINKTYTTRFKSYNEFKFYNVVENLQDDLDRFIVLFMGYLRILECLNLKNKIKKNEIFNDKSLLKIYSFNYTKTSEKLYDVKKIDFLHGNIESSNIVLGVSDLSVNILEKYNFYGFVKYHQKIMKATNYNFLVEDSEVMASISNSLGDFYKDGYDFNIIIWGHSLDRSDEDYIKEIFSFNGGEEKVKVIIYYFNKKSYFDLLSNLFLILGVKKVELWMKKGWLKFEENPDIAKLNNIVPVQLPKLV